MKRSILTSFLFLVCAAFALAQKPATHTYTGAIMDSTCAANGNHDAGYKLTNTHTAKDCTLACVNGGAKFVLYNAKTKKTYQLDNQTEPRQFAGRNVRVSGTLDASTDTIHVAKITAARS